MFSAATCLKAIIEAAGPAFNDCLTRDRRAATCAES